MAISLTTEYSNVIQLHEAIDDVRRLNIFNSFAGINFEHKKIITCTTNEEL